MSEQMPIREVARRASVLTAVLLDAGYGSDGAQRPLIPGRNVDTKWLPVEGVVMPKPSIEHSIVKCTVCQGDMWLGPQQMKARGIRLCYLCISVFYLLHQDHDVVDIKFLNPNEADIPRRT